MSANDNHLDYLDVPVSETDRLLTEAEKALEELKVGGADPEEVLEPLVKAVRELWHRRHQR